MSLFSRGRSCAPVHLWLLVAASALVACSTEVEVRTPGTGAPTATPAAVAEDAAAPGPSPGPPPGIDPSSRDDDGDDGDDDAETDASAPTPETALHTPARGESVAVIGVAFDEAVAVRSAARQGAPVVAELSARFDGAIGSGRGRTTGSTGWWEILVGENRGWVDASFMARLGATTDVTTDVVAGLGRTPVAPTLRALGRIVTDARLGADTPGRVVLSGAPRRGAVGDVIYDIVDRTDASVAGERLVVFATPDGDGDGFALRAVESTIFCARGVTGDGRCT